MTVVVRSIVTGLVPCCR